MKNKVVTLWFDVFVTVHYNYVFLFQESHAFSLYNKGLSLQRQGDLPGAEQAFKKILQIDVVDEVQLYNLENKNYETCSLDLKNSIGARITIVLQLLKVNSWHLLTIIPT